MTTVPGVMDAFNEIYAFGRRCNSSYHKVHRTPDGREYHFDGPGDDFYQSHQVADIANDRTVPAEAMLRIIAADNSSLYLAEQLVWRTSFGYRHESYASYLITPEAAERLAATDVESLQLRMPGGEFNPLDDVHMAATMDALWAHQAMLEREATAYCATWRQVWPQENLELYLLLADSQDPALDASQSVFSKESRQEAEFLRALYHAQVVRSLREANVAHACMLSGRAQDLPGMVHPQQLVTIAEWVRSQPPAAS